jgi:peptidoglycan L-alanyl-D-glutamate endopeptidase CwlK
VRQQEFINKMADRNINDLDPRMRALCLQWMQNCSNAGLRVCPIVTWRSAADQDEAHEKGLSNAKAGQSPHNCVDAHGNPASMAFDFGVFEIGGAYVTDGEDPRYELAGTIGKRLGLAWGGDWKSLKDYDHLELPGWGITN